MIRDYNVFLMVLIGWFVLCNVRIYQYMIDLKLILIYIKVVEVMIRNFCVVDVDLILSQFLRKYCLKSFKFLIYFVVSMGCYVGFVFVDVIFYIEKSYWDI